MTGRARYESPLGAIILTADGDALTGLWFEGQKYFAEKAADTDDLPVLRAAQAWLNAYFAGEAPDPAGIPLRPQGSAFRLRVWNALREIPYGETVSYGGLAKKLSEERPTSARAVGGAAAHNPISLLIPCHRVVGADGSLTGYAGGTERKRRLLLLEAETAAR